MWFVIDRIVRFLCAMMSVIVTAMESVLLLHCATVRMKGGEALTALSHSAKMIVLDTESVSLPASATVITVGAESLVQLLNAMRFPLNSLFLFYFI
jgi:hypothetical protein